MLDTENLQYLLDHAASGPVTIHEDEWGEVVIANRAGHEMSAWGDQIRLVFEAGDIKVDGEIYAAAPQLLAEVIRLRKSRDEHVQHTHGLVKYLRDHHPDVYSEISTSLTAILNGEEND